MKTVIVNAIITYVLPLVVLAATTFLGFACKYLQTKTAKVKDEKERGLLNSFIDESKTVIEEAITATNQTFVNDIKADIANGGKLTDDQIKQAREQAMSYFLSHISAGALTALKNEFGDIEAYVVGLIEAKLGLSKTVTAAVTAAAQVVPTKAS